MAHLAMDLLKIHSKTQVAPIISILEKIQVFVLVAPPLNDHNWSRTMKHALSSTNKLKFITGALPQLAEFDPLYEPWERCDYLVVSWITRTLYLHISLKAQAVLTMLENFL